MRSRNNLKTHFTAILLVCTALLSIVMTACSSGAANTSANNTAPQRGGTIRFATIGDPPTLDMMSTTVLITQQITTNIFEGLFTLDSHFAPKPSLAQSYQIEDQGLRWVIILRKGVLFHNGQEMTSADVLASLNRWGKIAQYGHVLFANLVNLIAPDKYTIVIQLKKPMPIVPVLLAVPQQQAAIYPKSVIDAAGNGPIKQYIGTGPYKFVVWQPNQYIELARVDQYQARTEPTDGMAGKRVAYADQIRFIPVPDVQQRVQGVQTGLYDFADEVSPDLYPTVKNATNVDTVTVKPWWYPVIVFNKKQGTFANLKMRQAVQAALDFTSMMQAAFGDPIFYRLDPSIYFKETSWWSNAGQALYNQNNPGKAKQLLQEAGYHGQTIRVITTQQYDWMYKLAVVMKSQLEAIGMHVSITVLDWASLTQARMNPAGYDIFTTGINLVPDPAITSNWSSTWPGWWVNPQKDALLQQLATEPNYNKRLALESQFQQLWYEDVPMLKTGDFFLLGVKSKKLHGAGLTSPLPYLFNCWLSQ
jgi:peptide/nickel transport system substrate-binding protein